MLYQLKRRATTESHVYDVRSRECGLLVFSQANVICFHYCWNVVTDMYMPLVTHLSFTCHLSLMGYSPVTCHSYFTYLLLGYRNLLYSWNTSPWHTFQGR